MAVEFIPNPLFPLEISVDPQFTGWMAEQGDAAFEELKSRIPVDTGALLASAAIERLTGGGQRLSVSTDYWSYVEYGTSNMAPQSFLRNTLDVLGLHH